ncbi:MAG: oligosaccharide flippase family protein [Nanoarchaeota archaeon]
MINLKNPVIRGSLVLLVMTGFFNFLNFLYHVLMARTLSIEDFGLLKRVFVFLYLGAVFMESIQTIITKYSAEQASDKSKLKDILKRSFRKIGKISLIIFIAFAILAIPITYLFDIPYPLLLMTGAFLSISMIVPITRGIIQGQQRFYDLGFAVISEGIFKVSLALLFVWLGWRVYGAVTGVLLSVILTLGVSLFYLKDIIKSKESPAKLSGIRDYSWPVFFVTATLILFFNLDVLFSGYFFNDTLSGIYAIASTIALVIFVGTQPINRVLFPITANNTAQKKPSRKNFIRAASLVLFCAFCALFVIWFFPDFLVKLFSGKVIAEASSIVMIMGLSTTILSLTSLILYYKLSQGKTQGYKFIPLFLVIELILLSLLHTNLLSFSLAFLASNIIFLIGAFALLNR